ncbi:hypothetical protein [Porcipelethomonas sp.]|uniref:hypothetical protein n=1 Tax=Porcipelethomonas sp. TaxID=2981675 RepID=UPI003EF32C11
MCKLFDEWVNEIKAFCIDNSLDFDKAKSMSQSWGKNFVALSYYDKTKGTSGLLDDTPMPLVLLIKKTSEGLTFEQTENTKKYLGKTA